jgi:hypothetical protein
MPEAMTDTDWILDLFNYAPGKRTIEEFVKGCKAEDGTRFSSTGLPASRVRRAIGELYGLGFVKVVEVADGCPVWGKTSVEERCSL